MFSWIQTDTTNRQTEDYKNVVCDIRVVWLINEVIGKEIVLLVPSSETSDDALK